MWNHRLCNETSSSIQQQIADYFSIFLGGGGLPIKHRTVGDIISSKETYESVWCQNVHVNKFDECTKTLFTVQTIISVCHVCIMKYCFYKLK
jgi:hypothetical protein